MFLIPMRVFCWGFLVVAEAVTLSRKPYQHPHFINSLKPLSCDNSMTFLVRDNPFYVYLDVNKLIKDCDRKQVCLCYWGHTPDRPNLYQRDLSAAEKEHVDENGYPEIRPAQPHFSYEASPCVDLGMDSWISPAEITMRMNSYMEAGKKTDHDAEMFNHFGGKIEKQALCFKVKPERADNDFMDLLLHVEVQATPDSSSETYRFRNEGIIPILINTRKAVTQTIASLPSDIAAIFYLVPRMFTFYGFDAEAVNRNSYHQQRIEDRFVEFGIKGEWGCNALDVLYYDPSEIMETQVMAHPQSVSDYLGTFLTKQNVSHPRDMRRRNATSSLIPLFDEFFDNIDRNVNF